MCGGVEIPKTLACVYGSTLVFEIFMTSSVIYNALETPHRKKSDVVANVLKDGAKLLFALLLFRIFCLLTSIIGDPSQVFSILSIGWAINSIIVGRIHLRLLHLLSLRADTSENNDHERDRVRLTGADASSRTRNDEERGVLERDEGCDNDNDTIEDTMVMTPRLPQMAQYPFVNS
ncbi:hypothetical protein VKT23_013520 [Stygiomarasmius scandens]|uniref:Uncharacterized protein n=1 Tax=Marasmiellus scandens TaxID=2682957 RepID=A0ABR1J363_9AGAR